MEVQHESFAKFDVQKVRSIKKIPNGRPLHDYVNLYINARNTTLFRIKSTGPLESLCVLRVGPGVLDLPGVFVTNKNAAHNARFEPAPNGVQIVRSDLAFTTYWSNEGHASIMCSEVLVPEVVPPNFLMGIYIPYKESRELLTNLDIKLEAEIDRHLFFIWEK